MVSVLTNLLSLYLSRYLLWGETVATADRMSCSFAFEIASLSRDSFFNFSSFALGKSAYRAENEFKSHRVDVAMWDIDWGEIRGLWSAPFFWTLISARVLDPLSRGRGSVHNVPYLAIYWRGEKSPFALAHHPANGHAWQLNNNIPVSARHCSPFARAVASLTFPSGSFTCATSFCHIDTYIRLTSAILAKRARKNQFVRQWNRNISIGVREKTRVCICHENKCSLHMKKSVERRTCDSVISTNLLV